MQHSYARQLKTAQRSITGTTGLPSTAEREAGEAGDGQTGRSSTSPRPPDINRGSYGPKADKLHPHNEGGTRDGLILHHTEGEPSSRWARGTTANATVQDRRWAALARSGRTIPTGNTCTASSTRRDYPPSVPRRAICGSARCPYATISDAITVRVSRYGGR